MKIAWFSEVGENLKYPRTFLNARTEIAWCLALDAPMCSLSKLPKEEFDLGIVLIPKENINIDFDGIRKICKKVAVAQEGPQWLFQDYTIERQFCHYNNLLEADFVFCHNESDVSYYKGLGCQDVRVIRSLMITDGLKSKNKKNKATLIGGNFVSWYGGFDSYIVAREIGYPISCPSMGRKQTQEDAIDDINYLPYLGWRDWVKHLSEYGIGIHLMRTYAAGTFSMNCAFHGIPCVGYEGLDTQKILHPLTTVKLGDVNKAKKIAVKLRDDEDFYNLASQTSLYKFKKHYSEQAWLKKWRNINEK